MVQSSTKVQELKKYLRYCIQPEEGGRRTDGLAKKIDYLISNDLLTEKFMPTPLLTVSDHKQILCSTKFNNISKILKSIPARC